MSVRPLLILLLVLIFSALLGTGPATAQSFSYARDCVSNVDNATIHVPASDSLTLPNGRPIEPSDTIAVYTDDQACAGYGVWTEAGATFAAAGPDSIQSNNGYTTGEPLKFEVFDVSAESATDLESDVTYASCGESILSLCRDGGSYANGTVHQVKGFESGNPLPVELATFKASLDGTTAVLAWKTSSETNNAGFEVQHRGPDASGYDKLGFVEGAGSTREPQSYRFRTEDLPPGPHQFRLRQVDTDGTSSLSDPVSVEVRAERKLTLRAAGPNPVRQTTQLTFTVRRNGPTRMVLYNLLGQEVKVLHDRTATTGNRYSVTVTANDLSSGTYFARLQAPTGTKTQRIVVVR